MILGTFKVKKAISDVSQEYYVSFVPDHEYSQALVVVANVSEKAAEELANTLNQQIVKFILTLYL